MTSQQFLVCDSSTLVNFKQWAKAISDFFTTAGWVQAADTGQVNWTSIASVPGSGAFVYEIWKPGDALTVFYLKVEYGNQSGTNAPNVRLSLGTGTNGAGTLTGFFFGPVNPTSLTPVPPSTTTQFECNFSGANNRIGVMMWRNAGGNCPVFFGVERSVDSSGAYTSAYVTQYVCGVNNSNRNGGQRSLVFGIGAGIDSPANGNSGGGMIARVHQAVSAGGTSAFNNAIPFDLATPSVGYFDYSSTVVGVALGSDITEAVTFNVTVYGSTRTYLPSKVSPFNACCGTSNNAGTLAMCMRYD